MTRLLWLVVVLCSTLTRGTTLKPVKEPTELTRHGHGDSVDQSHTRALRSFIASVSPEPEVVSEHTSGHTFSKEIIETIASVSPEQKVVSEHTSGRTFSKEIKLEGKQDQVGWGKSGDAAIKRAFQQTIAQTLTDALPAQMTVAPGDIAISKVTIQCSAVTAPFVTKVLLDVSLLLTHSRHHTDSPPRLVQTDSLSVSLADRCWPLRCNTIANRRS